MSVCDGRGGLFGLMGLCATDFSPAHALHGAHARVHGRSKIGTSAYIRVDTHEPSFHQAQIKIERSYYQPIQLALDNRIPIQHGQAQSTPVLSLI